MRNIYRPNITLLIIFALFWVNGSGKDVIGTFKPEGKSMESIPLYQGDEPSMSEESLSNIGSGDIYGANPDMEDEGYKKEFGRSTAPLIPIYFDFDRDDIRADQINRLEKNGHYLLENPAARVMVAGNCDERGTSEYNLGLGERRAIRAKQYLIKMGIAEERIRTVSFGDEMPLFPGSDEWSWSRNRRDDFILE